MLELVDRVLQLLVEHAAVGNDHDRIEDHLVLVVVQAGEPVSEPGDGVALAAAGRVHDQVVVPGLLVLAAASELPHRSRAGGSAGRSSFSFLTFFPSDFLLDDLQVHEPGEDVEQAVALPDLLPQVGGLVAASGCPGCPRQPSPLLKGRKSVLFPGEAGGHVHQVGIDGEVDQRPLLELEEQVVGVAVVLVLPDGVVHILAGQGVLQFGGDDRDAIQTQSQVEGLGARSLEQQLANNGEPVLLVEGQFIGIHAVARAEVRDFDRLAKALEAVAQHVEAAARVHGLAEFVQQGRLRLGSEKLLQLLQRLWLCVFQERHELRRVDGSLLVEVRLLGLDVASRCDQVVLDRRLEGFLFVVYWHSGSGLLRTIGANVNLAGDGGGDEGGAVLF